MKGEMKMAVYQISVYDKNWKLLHVDYGRFDDRQQAELKAEAARDWLDSTGNYEVIKIR